MKAQNIFENMTNINSSILEEYDREINKKPARKPHGNKFRILTALAASLAVLLVAFTACAIASPGFRAFLHLTDVTNNEKFKQVPDGFVGIYSAEDIQKIRNEPAGNYILMNDVDFGGAEIEPLCNYDNEFCGIFNGNGHVISNFKINVTDPDEYRYGGDLKGGCDYMTSRIGFFGDAETAKIKNLGIENAEINVTDATRCDVGIIAGRVGYLSTSYAKNCKINLYAGHLDVPEPYGFSDNYQLAVGGLCGVATTVDSCSSNVDISLNDLKDYVPSLFPTDNNLPYNTVCAGKLAGYAYCAITSWADGQIIDNTGYFKTGLVGYFQVCPAVIPAKTFEKLDEKISLQSSRFKKNLFEAYYLRITSDADNDKLFLVAQKSYNFTTIDELFSLYYYDGYTNDIMADVYLFDPTADPVEINKLNALILTVFTPEELNEIYSEINLKIGDFYCVDITSDEKMKESDFKDFDFRDTWKMKDGRPALTIFS